MPSLYQGGCVRCPGTCHFSSLHVNHLPGTFPSSPPMEYSAGTVFLPSPSPATCKSCLDIETLMGFSLSQSSVTICFIAVCIEHRVSFVWGWDKMDRDVHSCAQGTAWHQDGKPGHRVQSGTRQPGWSVITLEKGAGTL